jgi:ribosomal protein S18 acetylase RimI-like enzyme
MTEVKFRSFEEADLSILPNLFIEAIQSVYPELKHGEWISDLYHVEDTYGNGGDLIVGAVDDEVVAMGGLVRKSDDVVEMKRVAVSPRYHGRGTGQALLDALEQRASDLGATKIILDTTHKQEAARHLYDKNGYTLIERRDVEHPSGETFDTYFYEKQLT